MRLARARPFAEELDPTGSPAHHNNAGAAAGDRVRTQTCLLRRGEAKRNDPFQVPSEGGTCGEQKRLPHGRLRPPKLEARSIEAVSRRTTLATPSWVCSCSRPAVRVHYAVTYQLWLTRMSPSCDVSHSSRSEGQGAGRIQSRWRGDHDTDRPSSSWPACWRSPEHPGSHCVGRHRDGRPNGCTYLPFGRYWSACYGAGLTGSNDMHRRFSGEGRHL
jgi:hypothetical protein